MRTKNTVFRTRLPQKPQPPSLEKRMAELFAKLAENPIFAWESRQQLDLAFVGALAAEGSEQIARNVIPGLPTLKHLTTQETLTAGQAEWAKTMARLQEAVGHAVIKSSL